MAKKILIIDDEPDVAKVLVYRLEAKGYEVRTEETGKNGLGAVRSFEPDLILLDYSLSDMTAIDVSGLLKKEEKMKDIPVILITATIEDIEEKAKQCQAADFMSKPIDPQELYAKLEKIL